MTMEEIAGQYVTLVQAGDRERCLSTLFDSEASSTEAVALPGREREVQGVEALRAKSRFFFEHNDVHRTELHGPYVHGERFIVRFVFELTFKPTGQRRTVDELGVFTVRDGRIVSESFFPLVTAY